VPDDDQDGPAYRDVGLAGAAAAGEPAIAVAEEGVGLGGSRGGVAQDGGELGVAAAGGVLAFLLAADSLTPGAYIWPRPWRPSRWLSSNPRLRLAGEPTAPSKKDVVLSVLAETGGNVPAALEVLTERGVSVDRSYAYEIKRGFPCLVRFVSSSGQVLYRLGELR
jgi:hypothetical protein